MDSSAGVAVQGTGRLKSAPPTFDTLLYNAMQQQAEHRLEWLQKHCSDEAVRNEVLSLLDAHERAGDFLQNPLHIEPPSSFNLSGRQLGPYEVDELIGHGGMGRVYRAHRNDGEYEQDVAVKLIESGHIDPDLLKHERQILADLQHPNIISLIDGGTLEEGVPYLIMEYVQGKPLHQYLEESSLSERQVMLLFCNLAKTVSHTHQFGVIHCDLKPDNVLVTEKGELKLLDFGLAHSFSKAVTASNPTSFALTPEYASPQRRDQPLPRLADDIYSLGVIFGVMLSGRTPKAMRSGDSGFVVDMSNIENALPWELKAIFHKATQAEPHLRYQTVDDLLADVFRWLDGLPLHAMTGTPGYRLGKFLRRHWLAVAAASTLLTGLLISVFIWQQQHNKTEQVQRMAVAQVDAMLQELDDRLERMAGSTATRLAAAEDTLNRLAVVSEQQPGNMKIKRAMADAHYNLGMLLGNLVNLHLNKLQRGREHIHKARDLYREVFNANPDNARVAERLSKMERHLAAHLFYIDGQQDKAIDLLERGLHWLEDVQARTTNNDPKSLATHLLVLSHLYMGADRLEDAAEGHRRAEVLLKRPDKADGLARRRNAKRYNFFLDEQAVLTLARKDYAEAKRSFEAIVQRYAEKTYWRDRRRSARAHYALGCIGVIDGAELSESLAHFSAAHDITRSLVEDYPAPVSLKWELQRYPSLDQIAPHSRNMLMAAFNCQQAHRISDPPLPTKSKKS